MAGSWLLEEQEDEDGKLMGSKSQEAIKDVWGTRGRGLLAGQWGPAKWSS